ncbi:ferrous iron transport protein B [Sediminitomix flava]|uniref:Ferrous iron transport protein B n=1 Tax=Sediminitomix flava TaxID=379075 RepID=A0A315ZC40_SEDFL|nr:ferrous iron transport protein B [Sediminitomix flava]PWJ42304.1 ferrous iron transport protein B [Sediminitomix flava]
METTQRGKRVALLGNPNVGKSSIFNQLTGLRQKVGNFPGVTVDKKTGTSILPSGQKIEIVDFPGTYSLYPTSLDERVVLNVLSNPNNQDYPDAVVYVADVTSLERHLLLLTQLRDLNLPVVLVINMIDLAKEQGITVDIPYLKKKLGVEIVCTDAREGTGILDLKTTIENLLQELAVTTKDDNTFVSHYPSLKNKAQEQIQARLGIKNAYLAQLTAHHYKNLPHLSKSDVQLVDEICQEASFPRIKYQIDETMARYDEFQPIVKNAIKEEPNPNISFSDRLDQILTHPILGTGIFFLFLFLMFQAIFSWASYPMDLIEEGFASLTVFTKNTLPSGLLNDLITDGLLAGLGGVLVFIPQIAILFFFISIMEEVGYMARAVYLSDRLMQKFGLNGRSLIALLSGGACAIPAIMSTRTISNWKERLITIMVTPLISCSARIPVYTLLVAFVVPATSKIWIFNTQGIVIMGLYLLGVVAALGSAWVLKKIIKTQESAYLMLEMPDYKVPYWKNIVFVVYEKVKAFALEAGQIIIVISIVLWALASYGPEGKFEQAESQAIELAEQHHLDEQATQDLISSKKLEVSYAGILGKVIEPTIRPLGFDWKIGISLISSFAAREVFVGTMATIYSVGSAGDDERTVFDKMAKDVNPITGEKVYSRASSMALLIFYVFAMQCMATLAVVKRETKSWKWPIVQTLYMFVLAYGGAFIAYNIF